MKVRLIVLVIVLGGLGIINYFYGLGQGTIEGSVAINQLNGGATEYVASQAVINKNVLDGINAIGLVVILGILFSAIKNLFKSNQERGKE